MSQSWTIQLTRQAKKDLDSLQRAREKALRAIVVLEQHPLAGHDLAGSLHGVRSLEFSLPGGAYRAAYTINAEHEVCLVFLIGPHESFYEKAQRRYRAL